MRHSFLLLVVIMTSGCGGNHRFASEAKLQKRHYRLEGHVEDGPTAASATRDRLEWVRPASPIQIQQDQQTARAPELVKAQLVKEADPGRIASLANRQVGARGLNGSEQATSEPEILEPQRDQEAPPERAEWNWLAVASPIILVIALVAAIPAQSTELLLIGCLAALAAAIIGARQCREKGQKGQGFAMAVMGLAAAGALIALIALLSRL